MFSIVDSKKKKRTCFNTEAMLKDDVLKKHPRNKHISVVCRRFLISCMHVIFRFLFWNLFFFSLYNYETRKTVNFCSFHVNLCRIIMARDKLNSSFKFDFFPFLHISRDIIRQIDTKQLATYFNYVFP